jgi:hypothetical protein
MQWPQDITVKGIPSASAGYYGFYPWGKAKAGFGEMEPGGLGGCLAVAIFFGEGGL